VLVVLILSIIVGLILNKYIKTKSRLDYETSTVRSVELPNRNDTIGIKSTMENKMYQLQDEEQL